MHILLAVVLAQVSLLSLALPTDNGITTNVDVILLDAPAFADPSNPTSTLASVEAFVLKPRSNVIPTIAEFRAFLALFGVHVGDSLTNLSNRAKLFAASGEKGRSVTIAVDGCSKPVFLPPTNSAIFNQNVSLGNCQAGSNTVANAQVVLSPGDSRTISANVFFHSDSGFGVISDVDDTIKITNVLHAPAMLKATFLDDPAPVAGMPKLYSSLAKTLSPDFFYISGSMLQLQPFLHDFIHTTYSDSKGPIFLRNLTSIHDIVNLIQSNSIFDYKLSIIDQIHGMYPNKKFLAIGDSTQKDPETYGTAFRKFGDFIACAWIRHVDGADNSAARFAAAFAGAPSTRWRVFRDSDITRLASVNVAGGHC